MANAVIILVLLVIIIPAVRYIVKEKKKGRACVGCPDASKCGKNCLLLNPEKMCGIMGADAKSEKNFFTS